MSRTCQDWWLPPVKQRTKEKAILFLKIWMFLNSLSLHYNKKTTFGADCVRKLSLSFTHSTPISSEWMNTYIMLNLTVKHGLLSQRPLTHIHFRYHSCDRINLLRRSSYKLTPPTGPCFAFHTSNSRSTIVTAAAPPGEILKPVLASKRES